MWVAFALQLQKLLTFFQQQISAYLHITQCKFYESFTNDIVSFEQLGPDKGMEYRVICRRSWKLSLWTRHIMLQRDISPIKWYYYYYYYFIGNYTTICMLHAYKDKLGQWQSSKINHCSRSFSADRSEVIPPLYSSYLFMCHWVYM